MKGLQKTDQIIGMLLGILIAGKHGIVLWQLVHQQSASVDLGDLLIVYAIATIAGMEILRREGKRFLQKGEAHDGTSDR